MALRICIASPEVLGPVRTGDVGRACTALAQELALAGHQVTLLYTSESYENGSEETWREYYRQLGVVYTSLPPPPLPPPYISPTVYEGDAAEKSYRVYEHLKAQDFDIIHFPDYVGIGYFCALARRQGIAFRTTSIWVTCHGPTLWARVGNNAPCDDIAFHVRDRLERGLVEHCDMLLSPSQYMLDWLRGQAWKLPARSLVVPNLMPRDRAASEAENAPPDGTGIPQELVLIGPLEPRKGMQIFCDAIDRLIGWLPNDLEITFLGKNSSHLGEDWLSSRIKAWPFGWKIVDSYDSVQASNYLRGQGRVAIMPSLIDNSPYGVLDCLLLGKPFLATDVGGLAELIRQEDRPKVLCQPTPIALAAAIETVLRRGAVTARPAHDQDDVRRTHLALYAGWTGAEALNGEGAQQAQAAAMPLVSVCILHRDRGPELLKAVGSIDDQTYRNFEIIVVDNGSTCAVATRQLAELEERYEPERLRVVRLAENVYEPKGRNAAAEAARGEFLLFMDDDNLAKPRELELFVTAALHTGADLYTCFADHFETEDPLDSDKLAYKRFLAIGDAGPVGLIFNAYGDVNLFVRRERFREIGGFVEDDCFNHAEDWRFLALAYSKGLKISVIPEALYWYRAGASAGVSWRKRDLAGALYRVAASASAGVAPHNPFLLLAQGLFWKAADGQRELEFLRGELEERNEQLARTRAALAQQRRINDHARQALQLVHEGVRQVVDVCGSDPRAAAVWTAARYQLLPYVQKLSHRADEQ